MKLNEVIGEYGFMVYSPPQRPDVEVAHGYASDLLSDVIANAGENSVWVTMQTHVNIIAVAALKDVAAIVVVSNHKPSDDTIEMAKTKGVCVLGTGLTSFEVCGRLYAAGVKGGAG